jgi:hypothetical protein
MASRETGKQRAARIPLDYYKRPNRMERRKNALAVLALLLTVGVAGAAWMLRDGGKAYISRGPVASVHAAWENKCEACHTSFQPMSKNSFLSSLFGAATGAHDSAANLQCSQCHDGTPHHKNQLDTLTPSCGGCHRDHRGTDASLVQLPDSDCTQCHANLQVSMKEGKTDFKNDITGFADPAQGHPEFRSLKTDPGRLKFNHALHMRPGQVIAEGQANPWTLGKITDEAARERYRNAPSQAGKQENSDMVRLDCSSCHRLDAGDFGIDAADKPAGLLSTALTPRAAGAYMLPVNYEIHCAACHPLTFDPKITGEDKKPLSVPHHLQPEQVKNFVWGAYAAAFSKKATGEAGADAAKAPPSPSRPLPGKLTAAEEKAAREKIGKQADEAGDFLFKADVKRADGFLTTGKSACGECHVFDTSGGSKRILPLQVKNVWLEHAKFNHVSHRAVDCRACHPNAYAFKPDGIIANPTASEDHSTVLIEGIESCRICHSPAGGVRFGCSECHLYHHGERPLQGIGAAARDPRKDDRPDRFPDAQQFLKGTRN